MMRFLIYLLLFFILALPQRAFATPDVTQIYGDTIEFDVLREGKVVGEHITAFEKERGRLSVKSKMELEIFLLFIPVYSFSYQAEETWVDDGLNKLNVNVLDGTERVAFSANRQDDKLEVVKAEQSYLIDAPIISTNHWNVNVVGQNRVLNTLTGNINNVTIIKQGREPVETSKGSIEATRYDYQGDLKDTSVWYDDQGRWVKLRFKARDGSIIDYRCRTCASGEVS